MGKRRTARECALQILFQLEFNAAELASLVRDYWKHRQVAPEVREYATRIVEQISGHQAEIDEAIQAASKNWRLSRMAVVDRNILRIAVCEFLFEPALDRAIVIDEAIEVAKRYSGQESADFVNGILDAVARTAGSGTAVPAGRREEGHHEQDRRPQGPGSRRSARRKPGE